MMVRSRPFVVRAVSASVIRVTLQSLGASCPISELGPQQYSTIRLRHKEECSSLRSIGEECSPPGRFADGTASVTINSDCCSPPAFPAHSFGGEVVIVVFGVFDGKSRKYVNNVRMLVTPLGRGSGNCILVCWPSTSCMTTSQSRSIVTRLVTQEIGGP